MGGIILVGSGVVTSWGADVSRHCFSLQVILYCDLNHGVKYRAVLHNFLSLLPLVLIL